MLRLSNKAFPLTRQLFSPIKASFSSEVTEIIKQKTTDSRLFEHFDINDIDTSNIISSFTPPTDFQTLDLISKFSYLRPKNLYFILDETIRDTIFYIANDLGLGVGLGIIGVSMALKLIFGPFMLLGNINAIKMKLIEPEMKNFQAIQSSLSKTKDISAAKEAREQFMQLRERHRISSWIPLFSLMQFPFLMTLFFAIRYITAVPDKYPEILTGGFFWFKDLSLTDPYGVLPILSSFISYTNIRLNPSMAISPTTFFGRYMKYMKYMPFFSIPFAIFFPAGLTLYWCFIAITHLMICILSKSKILRKVSKIPEFLPGTILEKLNKKKNPEVIKAVFEDLKKTDPQGHAKKVQVFLKKPIKGKKEDVL